jgi:uncharacterized protein (TIGR03083 family)
MTATCHRKTHDEYCQELRAPVGGLVEIAAQADPDAPVPSCPGWSMRQLLEHIGGVNRWATELVRRVTPERIRASTMDLKTPADPSGLAEWLDEGGQEMVEVFAAADPEQPMWAWGSDKFVRFWPRRMLHETTIHLADARLASDQTAIVAPDVATDGIDEFLDNLPHAEYFAPGVAELRGDKERILFASRGLGWRITFVSDGFEWEHSLDDADVRVEGPVGQLYLMVWGRLSAEALRVDGDEDLLARWVKHSAI